MTANWQFWIDRGGTFTDVVGRAPDNSLRSLKLLSENPGHYADAAAEGIRRMLQEAGDLGSARVDEIRMGTTVATNALLEHGGMPTALLTTAGCKDALRIAYQNRPDIFALHIQLPEPLYAEVREVSGRIDANGVVLTELDPDELRDALTELRSAGFTAIAICFMHAWINSAHEHAAEICARELGFTQISVSSTVSPLMKLISRGDTTVVDAYLSPVLSHYVDSFQHNLAAAGIHCDRIRCMQSNGGLVAADLFRGKDSVLSGPAGGVVGMGAAAAKANLSQCIGFDMGGTSTDVSVYAGRPELANETLVAGHYLRTPMIRIHTIAAGGGSILAYRDGRFQAGPESAGAHPGPMCYGRGGPLTVTDANLLLGRIQADHFPQSFGPNADQPLDQMLVARAFEKLAAVVSADTGRNYTAAQTAQGFLRVAVENMAHALTHISVQQGLNPAEFALCCFGGAGGQHACQVADRLNIGEIIIDPLAGVLSAWGMGAAPLREYRQLAINQPLTADALQQLRAALPPLEQACQQALTEQGIASEDILTSVWLDLKVVGSDTTIDLPIQDSDGLRAAFVAAHHARFGFTPASPDITIESARIEVASSSVPPTAHAENTAAPVTERVAQPTASVQLCVADAPQAVPIYERKNLHHGNQITGPALITEATGTTVLDPGWKLSVNQAAQLVLSRAAPANPAKEPRPAAQLDTANDPVMLEIFNNHFMHIADEMGAVLQNTSRSVNIKERLDFSCALFSTAGELIANAPHIPVHLGSMDDSVQTLLREHHAGLLAGNSYLCNAPYNGGTHLPDLTVVSPVLSPDDELLFVVAARAHHADIGGITPGSMPPDSQHIDEEGIVFDGFPLVVNGHFREDELRDLLAASRWPARNPEQNVADFKAQLAANERGRKLLLELVGRYSVKVVHAYVEHALDNAEESVRRAIADLANSAQYQNSGTFEYPFDNGQLIKVSVKLDAQNRSAVIDFTGTSPAAHNNLNAPSAVCQAAVMYVFRTLVATNMPLNAGCRRPLQLQLPADCMLNPSYPAAVVGGNVETSQCITDALYGALGVLAASQGTMNNLSFGNAEMQYYETICGGAGAGPDFAGAAAVQTHMTNSRMTDPEVLESRYPVLVREFSIRVGSGGNGRWRGGDGVIRKLEFRAEMSAAILSNHRRVAPFGLAGGLSAATGNNRIERRDGTIEQLAGTAAAMLRDGDIIVIETPGGGGYGKPTEPS